MVAILIWLVIVKAPVTSVNRIIWTQWVTPLINQVWCHLLVWLNTNRTILDIFLLLIVRTDSSFNTTRQLYTGKWRCITFRNFRFYSNSKEKCWFCCKTSSVYSIVSKNDQPALWSSTQESHFHSLKCINILLSV